MKEVAIVTLDENVTELEDLASSAGLTVVMELIQRRDRPHRSTFVGKGKLTELKDALAQRPVEAVIFNGDLKPSQHYLLENQLGVECVDRIRLVLDIFTSRASSAEARLQVLRARLRYEMPLLREWVHNARAGEHPGFLGSGDYETASYYELIRRQLSRVESELAKLDRDRSLRRVRRRREGSFSIALAGYTNAGKSSLLNVLTKEKALVEDRMFSTLSTTTGRLQGEGKRVLITDTIGFLSDLPHFLIESFKSTIDEVHEADLVLLVMDASDPEDALAKKLATSRDILLPEVDPASIIIVLSKVDKVSDVRDVARRALSAMPCRGAVAVSSLTGQGMEDLRDVISSVFRYPLPMAFRLPYGDGTESFLSWLHTNTEVSSVERGDAVDVRIACREKDHSPIVSKVIELGGTPL